MYICAPCSAQARAISRCWSVQRGKWLRWCGRSSRASRDNWHNPWPHLCAVWLPSTAWVIVRHSHHRATWRGFPKQHPAMPIIAAPSRTNHRHLVHDCSCEEVSSHADGRMQNADCRMQIADCRLQMQLQIAEKRLLHPGSQDDKNSFGPLLPTAFCRLLLPTLQIHADEAAGFVAGALDASSRSWTFCKSRLGCSGLNSSCTARCTVLVSHWTMALVEPTAGFTHEFNANIARLRNQVGRIGKHGPSNLISAIPSRGSFVKRRYTARCGDNKYSSRHAFQWHV